MQYTRAYRFLFDNPNWLSNLLFCTLCVASTSVVPIVGYIVLLGYLFEILDFMQRQGSDTGYPDFTFDRFKDYLVRGAWPFLEALIVSLPVTFVLLLTELFLFFLGLIAFGKDNVALVLVGVYLLWFLALLVVNVVLPLLLAPMMLRAGLMDDFKAGFDWEFIKEFMRRVGKDLVVVQLFMVLTGTLLTLVGVLFCIVGAFPAAALATVAQYHLWWQVYQLYLQRGGTPIRLKGMGVLEATFAPPAQAASPPDATIQDVPVPFGGIAASEAAPPGPKTEAFPAPEMPPPEPPPV